jgi:probable F420-dependent oxidoreductase
MKLGLSIYGHDPAHVVRLGARADELGFDVVWLGEHLVAPVANTTPHPHRPDQDPPVVGLDSALSDPWVVIGAISGATTRLRSATGVSVLPLRHPLLTARAAVSAHDVSGGRVVLGAGSGWCREEFDAFGVPFAERGTRLDETLDVLRKAFARGPFAHEGRHFAFDAVQVSPRPVTIPIVIGGVTERAMRRAAMHGDGWYSPSTMELDECLAVRRRIDALRSELGTADRPFTYFVRMNRWPAARVVGTYLDAGFDHLSVSGFELWPPRRPQGLAEKLGCLDRVAEELHL